jgi:hypothetical protein
LNNSIQDGAAYKVELETEIGTAAAFNSLGKTSKSFSEITLSSDDYPINGNYPPAVH